MTREATFDSILRRVTGYNTREVEELKHRLGWRGTMDPTLIMLCGPSCAGKSTVSLTLRDLFQARVLGTDDLIIEEALNRGTTYAEIFEEYFKTANGRYQAMLGEALKARENVILDRTHVTIASRRKVLARVPATYQRIAIAVGRNLSEGELIARAYRRRKLGGIYVPSEVIRRMHSDFALEPPATSEGFNIVLEYNSNA